MSESRVTGFRVQGTGFRYSILVFLYPVPCPLKEWYENRHKESI